MTQPANNPLERETRRRVRAVRIALTTSFLIGAVIITLGIVFSLESLIAEGIHTLLDGVDSIIVLITVVIAAKPADRSHQFGHGKFESVGAAIEGSFVLAAAGGIAYRAIDRLIEGKIAPAIPWEVSVVMLIAAAIYQGISIYLMREARATKSPAILAEALHLRTHIFIAGGLALGLIAGSLTGKPIVDNFLALGVAVCLVGIALHIFKEVFAQFTDAALPEDELKTLRKIVEQFSDKFVEVHGVRTRQSGAERHIEMHLVVLPDTPVVKAHTLSHNIEDAIAAEWPTTRITVHIEPLNTDDADHKDWIADAPKVRIDDDSPDQREFIH